MYKSAETKEKKIAVVLGSLILSTALFIAMAVLRSKLLEKQDMSISPVFFVIINMFFFIVSALLSYYLLPSWQEIVKHWNASKLLKAIAKRKEEITELKKEKETLKVKSIELTKAHLRMPVYAAYTIERIKKMYREAAELFKTVNLTYRTDRQMPDCFHDELPELDIPYLHNQYSLNNNEQ
jgi:hypothetical protein